MRVSDEHLERVEEGIQRLASATTTTITNFGLTKHDISGNIFQSGVLSYFAENDVLDEMQAKRSGVINYRLPSPVTFGSTFQPQYLYGVSSGRVKITGVTIDAPLYIFQVDKNNKIENLVNFNRQSGLRWSAGEHSMPERLFNAEHSGSDGVSSVKLLAKASEQGQKIYVLSKANDNDDLLNQINIDSNSRADIASALAAGNEVTVHEAPITINGWTGSGYISLNNQGVGGYIISVGTNGGFWESFDDISGWLMGFLIFGGLVLMLAGALGAVVAFSLILIFRILVVFSALLFLMRSDLRLIEAGCPDGLRILNALIPSTKSVHKIPLQFVLKQRLIL